MRKSFVVAFAMLASAVVWSGATVTAEQAAPAASAPTFNKDIAPILYANCTSCHRPGEIAPMSLMTYKDARPWAKAIASKVADGTMPPWHADPRYGKFVGERRLSDDQKSTFAKWVAAGAPEGNAADLPAAPTYNDGWNITPDVVLSMQEDYPIPAAGEVPYQYMVVPANFTEDRYISDWEIRPGDRRAVHHILLYLLAPKEVVEAQMKRQQQMMLQRMFGAPPAANGAPAAPRPQPPFEFACCVQIPDGQSGGRPLPKDQQKDPGPNYRPRPLGMAQGMGGFSPGGSIRHNPEGMGMRIPAGD
jgi:hypothetical protein